MTSNTTLQIKLPSNLKKRFENALTDSNLDTSSAIRVLMNDFANGVISIGTKYSIEDKGTALAEREIKSGKYVRLKDEKEINDFFDRLDMEDDE